MRADATGALVRTAAAHRFQVRGLDRDLHVRAQAVRRVKEGVQVRRGIFKAHEQIHQDGLVALAAESLAHAGAGHQGDRPLRGDAAGQNNDFHGKSEPFLLQFVMGISMLL